MPYVDYEYYTEVYMGGATEDFPRLAVRASSYLDYFTCGRVAKHAELDAVKMCCCALVDKYKVIEDAQRLADKGISGALEANAEVKSETVGGYSRTLATGGENATLALSAAASAKETLAATCREYLGSTGLLCRGGGWECTHHTL